LLTQQGYDTSFIYGGEAHFDNMKRFFSNNGFNRLIDQKDYVDPKFTGSRVVSDEVLLNKALQTVFLKSLFINSLGYCFKYLN
jgi:phosphoglycerol transferase MdoB-like AlkP superfamily enzyme